MVGVEKLVSSFELLLCVRTYLSLFFFGSLYPAAISFVAAQPTVSAGAAVPILLVVLVTFVHPSVIGRLLQCLVPLDHDKCFILGGIPVLFFLLSNSVL